MLLFGKIKHKVTTRATTANTRNVIIELIVAPIMKDFQLNGGLDAFFVVLIILELFASTLETSEFILDF